MKVIIAGSRDVAEMRFVERAVSEAHDEKIMVSQIVSGGARGVDKLGELYAAHHHIALRVFKANWRKHGRQAGFLRNGEMANYADALIAIWDGKSKGTKHMIETMRLLGKPVYVFYV